MSKLELYEEAQRLFTIYNEYKDSNDEFMRRKAHVDVDRFLMEHRELAMEAILNKLASRPDDRPRRSWRLFG